jgi:hypothetical protein
VGHGNTAWNNKNSHPAGDSFFCTLLCGALARRLILRPWLSSVAVAAERANEARGMRPRQLETKMCTYMRSFPRAAGSLRAAVGRGQCGKELIFYSPATPRASLRFTQMPASFSKFVATSLSAVHDLLTLFAPDAARIICTLFMRRITERDEGCDYTCCAIWTRFPLRAGRRVVFVLEPRCAIVLVCSK